MNKFIDKTDDASEIIIYCPYCGVDNHLPIYYSSYNTTGIVHCIKCGYALIDEYNQS